MALESCHRAHSSHPFLATGYKQLGHSLGPQCPGGTDWTHGSPGLPDTGWALGLGTGWARAAAPHRAPDLGKALSGELALEVNKGLVAHRAGHTDAAREFHAALGEVAGLGVVLDTDRVPKVAAVEDTDEALTSRVALGVGMAVGQEAGTGAAVALDSGPDAAEDRSLGADVTLHGASAQGRRRPRRVVGHKSQGSV